MLWLALACTPSAPTHTDDAPPAATGDTGTAPVDDLVVLSLNLHCLKLDGTPFADNPERMAHVAAFVAEREVDVLMLQEVCVGAEDATGLLQQALADATGEVFGYSWAYAHDAWVGTADEAREGLAIYARGEVELATPFDFVSPGVLRRVAVVTRLVGGPTLVNVHLDYDDAAAREDQARQAASFGLAIGGVETLIAGDLNARVGEPPHQALLDQGYEDATAGLEPGHIDHVVVHRGASWTATAVSEVLDDPAVSDHPGVLVHLARRAAPVVPVTRLVARVDVGFGNWISVRGDLLPLSWDRGWWAWPAAADRWELALTEVDAPFAFKFLRNDTDWEQGDDHAAGIGAEQELFPTF